MSAPEVGDRVRVHGEPYRGQYGHVADPTLVASAYLWELWVTLDGDTGPHGFALNEVEKVPTTPTDGHRGDETGADLLADLLADPDAGNGAQNGGKR